MKDADALGMLSKIANCNMMRSSNRYYMDSQSTLVFGGVILVSKRFSRSILARLRLFGISLILASCTFTADVPIEPSPATLPIRLGKVDATVGVFYGPALTSYVHTDLVGSSNRDEYPIGRASTDYFDTVFQALFARTTKVDGRPPLAAGASPVEAVIEVRIEDVHTDVRMFRPTVVATVSYRFILYSPRGETVASWTVIGGADPYTPEGYGVRWDLMGEATEHAMEEAGVKFMNGFRDVPAVNRWLASRNG